MKHLSILLAVSACLMAAAMPALAEKKYCLNDRVSVQNQPGWEEKSNYSTSCSFGRYSSADYAVFYGNLNQASTSQSSPQAMVQSMLNQTQNSEGIQSFQVLEQGNYAGNPLADYYAVVKYSKEYRVAHDIRISYYKMIVYSFGNAATPYAATAYVQNEDGSRIDQLFNAEQAKFYNFIDSIRFVPRLAKPIQIQKLPKLRQVLPR